MEFISRRSLLSCHHMTWISFKITISLQSAILLMIITQSCPSQLRSPFFVGDCEMRLKPPEKLVIGPWVDISFIFLCSHSTCRDNSNNHRVIDVLQWCVSKVWHFSQTLQSEIELWTFSILCNKWPNSHPDFNMKFSHVYFYDKQTQAT